MRTYKGGMQQSYSTVLSGLESLGTNNMRAVSRGKVGSCYKNSHLLHRLTAQTCSGLSMGPLHPPALCYLRRGPGVWCGLVSRKVSFYISIPVSFFGNWPCQGHVIGPSLWSCNWLDLEPQRCQEDEMLQHWGPCLSG